MLRLLQYKDGQELDIILPYHTCTPADWANFDAPIDDSNDMLQKYLNEPNKKLLCIDWDTFGDIIEIWGTHSNPRSYSRLEFVLLPCNYIHPTWPGDKISDECVSDINQ